MTEIPEDRSEGFHARSVGRREEGSWGRFLLKLGIQDVFTATNSVALGQNVTPGGESGRSQHGRDSIAFTHLRLYE